jgi:hypothetical protein
LLTTQASAGYQLLTGKELEVARDEVTEMASQLAEIDGRFIPDWGLEDPPFADEPQLRVAAAALLRFFVRNHVTDDRSCLRPKLLMSASNRSVSVPKTSRRSLMVAVGGVVGRSWK